MRQYRVEALENFVVHTVYYVDAKSRKEAETLCKSGRVAYDDKTIEEGDEQWLETVAVEECK